MNSTDERVKRGWVFYDWANSAYTLVVGTAVYPIYYGAVMDSAEVSAFLGTVSPTAAYTFTIAAAYLCISLLAPYLAAVAEVTGNKRSFMRTFVYLGVAACASMFFFTTNALWLGLFAPFLASFSFAGSLVFYNSYLPEIAAPDEQDALSARGFAMGYFGSSFLLIAVLVAVQNPQWFGAEATTALITRWSFVLVALWWLGFGEYALMRLPRGAAHRSDAPKAPAKPATAYRALYRSVAELLTDRSLRRFVLAFFFASAGVQTVILIASLFGSQVLGLPTSALITTILMIQYVAMAGAWLFSKMSRKWGNIPTLIVGAIGWSLVCVGAYFVQREAQFYALGAAVGLVMGGLQSLSRSTYSKMLPEAEDHVTYFSFYDIAEKLATVLGMASIGWLENATGDLRLAALVLVVYFLLALYFWALITFKEHQPTLRLGWTLAERDLRTRYAHSVLGSLWSLAQPLAMATALFFVGKAWNRAISADLWLLGWVVWNVFSSSAFSGALSLAHNRELVTKTAIPAFSYPLSKAIVAAVDGAVGLVLWGIFAVVTGVHANATLAVGALFAFAASLAGGLGMGALLALPAARVRDVAVALPFLAQLGLLLSPLLLGTSTSFSEHLPWIPGWGPVQAVLTQSVGSDVGYLWAAALLLLGMGFGVLKRWGKNAADWV